VPQPTQLTAVQQNARALRGNGDLAGARLMLEQALEVAKASIGEDHPEVLSTAHLLAGMHREAGEPAAARRVLEEAVAAGQLRYADGEPLMLALSYTLGTVADELGNRHEARRNFGRVAAAGPAVLGEDHAWVRAARGYLGGEAGAGASAPAQAATGGSPATPTRPGPARPVDSQPAPTQRPSPPPPPRTSPPPRTASPFQPPTVEPEPVPFPPPAVASPYQPPAYQQPPRPLLPPAEQRPEYPSFGPGTGITSAPARAPEPIPPPPVQADPARRGRGSTVAATIAAFAAVLAAAVTAVVVLTDDRASNSPPQGQGTSTGPSSGADASPPQRVRLNDERTVVTITWTDPSDGAVPFVILGNRTGEEQRIMGQIPAGTTKYRLNGLNANLEYCFIVVAVYSTDQLVPSGRVCTERSVTSARPSGTGAGTTAGG
jgi:hypothetical protein